MNRREFLQATALSAAALATTAVIPQAQGASTLPEPDSKKLPRWRGFNLLEKFTKRREGNPPFQELDFQLMEEWGCNFVRLPMSYLCWASGSDWLKIEESEIEHIDKAVELGRKHGIHVNINFHRAPGYCVNPPKEPLDLWTDDKALDACAYHWAFFARRYKGVPNSRVSFDLLNEPPDITPESYARVVRRLVKDIRSQDPARLVIADGLKWGTTPAPGLEDLAIAQSTRGYEPMQISHHQASWVRGSDEWPTPTWPLKRGNEQVDKETLRRTRIEPWKALERSGTGVHVGEWGTHNRTPHGVTLAWMRDCLELWKEAGWGWALWNLRGSFGVMDSQRSDVEYQDFRGHKLDAEMLKLLKTDLG